MNYAAIRKSLKLSQVEFAIFFGVPVASIRNWEQGTREPNVCAITLYKLVDECEQDVVIGLMMIACKKKYANVREARAIKNLLRKVIDLPGVCAKAQAAFLRNNKHFSPKLLGFSKTEIKTEIKTSERSSLDAVAPSEASGTGKITFKRWRK